MALDQNGLQNLCCDMLRLHQLYGPARAEQGCELLASSSFLKLHATSHAPQQIGLTMKRKLSVIQVPLWC